MYLSLRFRDTHYDRRDWKLKQCGLPYSVELEDVLF
jgi:hypothetical protein